MLTSALSSIPQAEARGQNSSVVPNVPTGKSMTDDRPVLSTQRKSKTTHEFNTAASVADLLEPGLSPVFSTSHSNLFRRYISAMTDEALTYAIPCTRLSSEALVLAISVANVGEPGDGAVLPIDVGARVAVAVPALAARHGFSCFQVWLGPALLARRKSLPPRDYWRCRLAPFLSLPVLHVPSPRADVDVNVDMAVALDLHHPRDFRLRLEAMAAALGHGRFVAEFLLDEDDRNRVLDDVALQQGSTKVRLTFHFEPSDGRKDSLRSRFNALLFAATSSALADCAGACDVERALFAAAAATAFPNVGALLYITPARNTAYGDMTPLWKPGISAWPFVLPHSPVSQADGVRPLPRLRDVVFGIRAQTPEISLAMRVLMIQPAAGTPSEWFIIMHDKSNEYPTVALVAIISRGTVVRSAAAVLDDGADFLDLTADIDIMQDNTAFRVAVEDVLTDCRLLTDGDTVVGARIVDETDDILLTRLQSSPSRRHRN